MTYVLINNGFMCFSETLFNCPYCGKEYEDRNDKYLNRCNNNKIKYTKIKCTCGEKFILSLGLTNFLTWKSVTQ